MAESQINPPAEQKHGAQRHHLLLHHNYSPPSLSHARTLFLCFVLLRRHGRRLQMATGWVKSLYCKSNAVDDVVYTRTPSSSSSSSSAKKPLLSSVSCGNTSHKDVFAFPKYPYAPPPSLPKKRHPKPKPKPKPPPACMPPSPAPQIGHTTSDPFPTLVELPAGHSSRRVVEIIFRSSWSCSTLGAAAATFPGEIEMLFRVHNPARAVARFEEYREAARARASRADAARCAADGNEVMRFHCGGGGGGGRGGGGVVYDAGVVSSSVWSVGAKMEGVRTFAGSGGAHASAGGGAGRRGMLVCRVVAGRVRDESDTESEAESVSLGNGELVVFDSRAVLPCFLIIYRL